MDFDAWYGSGPSWAAGSPELAEGARRLARQAWEAGAQVAGRSPGWSKEPPTFPGWWWLRTSPSAGAQVVSVSGPPGYFRVEAGQTIMTLGYVQRHYPNAEWCGPLEEPKQ